MNKEVDVLENELRRQLKSNEVLLMTLNNIRQQIIKTGKDIKDILAENPNALSLDRTLEISKVRNVADVARHSRVIDNTLQSSNAILDKRLNRLNR